jgi:hypothetical protein
LVTERLVIGDWGEEEVEGVANLDKFEFDYVKFLLLNEV